MSASSTPPNLSGEEVHGCLSLKQMYKLSKLRCISEDSTLKLTKTKVHCVEIQQSLSLNCATPPIYVAIYHFYVPNHLIHLYILATLTQRLSHSLAGFFCFID